MSDITNVVLITVDALRGDHLKCLGYFRETSPNLDNLARDSISFTQAISTGPITPASFIGILTSTYPLMYGGYGSLLNQERTTIAEVLKENGYNTATFHSNPYISRVYGYDRGFDTFCDALEFSFNKSYLKKHLKEHLGVSSPSHTILSNVKTNVRKKIQSMLPNINKNSKSYSFLRELYHTYNLYLTKEVKQWHGTADTINERAISWLQEQSGNFFLWMHYMDVHFPYIPPRNYLFQSMSKREVSRLNKKFLYYRNKISKKECKKLIALYDSNIRYVDYAIESLLNKIEEMGLLDNTLIIVTADHGDEFSEHGYFSHDQRLYDSLIHVPLIIHGPELKNATIEEPVSLLDLAPTILDLLNIQKPSSFMGCSLLPLIKGMKVKSSGVISEIGHRDWESLKPDHRVRKTSYRTRKWKYIYNENNRDELYNLQDDPMEQENLIDEEKEVAEELKPKILAHIQMEKNQRITEEKGRITVKIKELKDRGMVKS